MSAPDVIVESMFFVEFFVMVVAEELKNPLFLMWLLK